MSRQGCEWLEHEIDVLRTVKSDEKVAELLGRTKSAVTSKRHMLFGKKKDLIPPPAKAPFELTVDYIYGQFRRMMGIGQRITLQSTATDPDTNRLVLMRTTGVIKEKYPYYCKVKDLKTNETKCIQWVDVARWNPELMARKGA